MKTMQSTLKKHVAFGWYTKDGAFLPDSARIASPDLPGPAIGMPVAYDLLKSHCTLLNIIPEPAPPPTTHEERVEALLQAILNELSHLTPIR